MTEIHVYNVVSQVYTENLGIHEVLNLNLSFRPDGYIFSPAYKSGNWDGIKHMYLKPTPNRSFGKLWTGLLHRAISILQQNSVEYAVVDKRIEPIKNQSLVIQVEHRDYQAEAEDAAIGRTRGIIKAETAAGKTIIAARIISHLNLPSVFVVHKLNLFRQAVDDFTKILKVPIGIIQGENRKLETFNVATVQTLSNILDDPTNESIIRFIRDECMVLIVDECHHCQEARQFREVLQNFMSSYYRIGLSATPFKSGTDKLSADSQTEGLFGRIIYETERRKLEKGHYRAKARIFYL